MTADIPDQRPGLARTPSQKERRARILTATLDLLDESGAQALQMREVTARSGVALATVYRYFPSKDYLVVMALLSWSEGFVEPLWKLAAELDDPAERLIAMLDGAVDSIDAHRAYAAALAVAASSPDPLVLEAFLAFRELLSAFIRRALEGVSQPDPAVIGVIIEGVWLRALIELGFQNSNADSVKRTFARVVRLCFAS
ncbi:MAG: TetR family transcriptional regulator [Actinomycetota bacterium]|nr:TetR family transcriptional regulator [Actinomycetota bacterium]